MTTALQSLGRKINSLFSATSAHIQKVLGWFEEHLFRAEFPTRHAVRVSHRQRRKELLRSWRRSHQD